VAGSGQLSVLHWNIHSWRDDRKVPNEAAVEGLIRDLRPDAVSLTEVSTPWGQAGSLGEIGQRLGYTWVFVPALEFRGDPATEGYGNALLTRWPILGVQQWQVHSPAGGYANNEATEPRTLALAQVDADGSAVWAGSTHLPAGKQEDRARALRRLAGLLERLDTPWLVCGDFNTRISTWRDDLPDGVTVAPRWRRATFPARHPVRAIDYGLASPGARTRGRVLKFRGSDHRAIFVSAAWGGASPPRPPRA